MNTKQRAALRAQAHHLESTLHIGKAGITPAVVQQALEDFNTKELVKGTVQESCPLSPREALEALCAQTDAQPVQAIGRKIVLYKPFEE